MASRRPKTSKWTKLVPDYKPPTRPRAKRRLKSLPGQTTFDFMQGTDQITQPLVAIEPGHVEKGIQDACD